MAAFTTSASRCMMTTSPPAVTTYHLSRRWDSARRPTSRLSSFGDYRPALPALELDVVVGGGLGDRLDVAERDRLGHERADALLDLLGELVRTVHRPGVGHQKVKRDETPRTRLAGEQRVELDAVAAPVLSEDFLDVGNLGRGNRGVEQPRERTAHENEPRPQNERRHGERDQRIKDQPPGRSDERDASHDSH